MTRSRAGTWSSISLTRLADQMQRAAAAGAGLMLDIEPDVLARQVRRQARPLVCAASGSRSSARDGSVASTRAMSALRSSRPSCELIVIEPLGAPAELAALQLLDDEMEPLDLGLRLAESWCARLRASAPAAAASPHHPAGRRDRCP